MLLRFFNLITISALIVFILFMTAIFYIGSQETFERQVAEGAVTFFVARTFAGVVIGFLGCVIVLVGNLILDKKGGADRGKRIFQIVLLTVGLSLLSSLIGTIVFFVY